MFLENKLLLKNITLSVLVTLFLGIYLWHMVPNHTSSNTVTKLNYSTPNVPVQQNSFSIPTVVSNSINGVVGISALKINNDILFGNSSSWGIGSGVIVSTNGYILTNQHVTNNDSEKLVVTFSDGSEKEGTRVWSDEMLDLAIIKVPSSNLEVLPLGNSDTLTVGEIAIAIGNPLGLQFQRTVTSGIISALNRTLRVDTSDGENYMEDLIQTDASINPGNSGGPLLNSQGEVIGINTVKIDTAEGIGFAIPINIATPIINHFIEDNKFVEPYLGVFAYDRALIPYVMQDLTLQNGIIVVDVDENGPAYKSGIKQNSIIISIDDKVINTMLDLRSYLYSKKPGDVVLVKYYSDNELKSSSVKLTKKS
ncbi:MAG: trypsin-like peptidase domain-containing protein [Clostridiales bacterium]|nr:trypsin-like peptidase domain-containing protein [Clostridiales bacterium]